VTKLSGSPETVNVVTVVVLSSSNINPTPASALKSLKVLSPVNSTGTPPVESVIQILL
jgi:hypothetical protein